MAIINRNLDKTDIYYIKLYMVHVNKLYYTQFRDFYTVDKLVIALRKGEKQYIDKGICALQGNGKDALMLIGTAEVIKKYFAPSVYAYILPDIDCNDCAKIRDTVESIDVSLLEMIKIKDIL